MQPFADLKLPDEEIELNSDPDVQERERKLKERTEVSNEGGNAAALKHLPSADPRNACAC